MSLLSEHDLQASIIAECNLRANQDPTWGKIFAIPNGGDRDIRVASRLKAEGVRPGVPDLMLLTARRGYHGLVIELKVGKNRPTREQMEWLFWLEGQGFCTRVVRDMAAEAIGIIQWYLEG